MLEANDWLGETGSIYSPFSMGVQVIAWQALCVLIFCVFLGLATQFLTEVFSSNFLTPLEDTDTSFSLQVSY